MHALLETYEQSYKHSTISTFEHPSRNAAKHGAALARTVTSKSLVQYPKANSYNTPALTSQHTLIRVTRKHPRELFMGLGTWVVQLLWVWVVLVGSARHARRCTVDGRRHTRRRIRGAPRRRRSAPRTPHSAVGGAAEWVEARRRLNYAQPKRDGDREWVRVISTPRAGRRAS